MRRAAAWLALSLAACVGGCRARRAPSGEHAAPAPPAPAVDDGARLPAPWRLERLAGAGDFALPPGCALVPPVARAALPTDGLRFVAAAGAPAELLVARDGEPPEHGLVTLALASPAPSRRAPWPAVAYAAAAGRWRALSDAPADPPNHRLTLWREEGDVSTLGEGDHATAVDLRCTATRCAALATRIGQVARPGATLFAGSAAAPPSTWQRVDLDGPAGASDTHPLAVAALDDTTADVALAAGDAVVWLRVSGTHVEPVASLPVHAGVLDVTRLGGSGLALVASHEAPVDAQGCAKGGAAILLERPGMPPERVPTSAPPSSAFARPLASGALLAWIAPVDCRHHDRPIVHALRLDERGVPATSDVAVGDASGFTIETRGDDVELALRTPSGVAWVRARCGG